METLADLLATGDAGSLVLAVVSFAVAAVLLGLAVRLRPRTRRRVAR